MILDSKKFYGCFIGKPIFAKDLFSNLPLKTRKNLASIQQHEKINEGEIISKIGSFPENIYVLIKGKAQLALRNELNLKNITRLVERGEVIGLTQSLSGSPNEVNIVALSPCSVDVFSTPDFLNFLKNEPQVCFRLFNRLSLDVQSDYRIFSSMFF